MTEIDTSGEALELSCPWCECDQIVTLKLHGRHWAECMGCEARGPVEYSEANAWTAWNTRAVVLTTADDGKITFRSAET